MRKPQKNKIEVGIFLNWILQIETYIGSSSEALKEQVLFSVLFYNIFLYAAKLIFQMILLNLKLLTSETVTLDSIRSRSTCADATSCRNAASAFTFCIWNASRITFLWDVHASRCIFLQNIWIFESLTILFLIFYLLLLGGYMGQQLPNHSSTQRYQLCCNIYFWLYNFQITR